MGAPARALGDVEMDDLFEDEEVKELLDKIGGECKDALKKHILDTIEEVLVTVILKELFCWLDEKGDDCIEYKKKLDKKLTTMKAECKKRGEVCNATESFPVSKSEYNKTTVKDCLPLVCHDKVPLASIFLEKVLNEMSDRCKENKFGKCKLSLHCASGHKSLDA